MIRSVSKLLGIFALMVLLAPAFAAGQAATPPENPINIDDLKVLRTTDQAGGHPEVNIQMRFCNEGRPISGASNTTPIKITTPTPHALQPGRQIRLTGVKGNTAANGIFILSLVPLPGGGSSPNEFFLNGSAGNGEYTGGGEYVHQDEKFGCLGQASTAYLRDFMLRLPPGFVGNPEAVPACPTFLYLAGSCPDNTQVGHAFADTAAQTGVLIPVPTSVFRIETLGLEPARLGTEVVPASPPGPLTNFITVRTTGDYGIDSAQINIPKDLGGPVGVVRFIDIKLCSYAPCQETNRLANFDVAPLPGAKPFFVNPTSCTDGRVVALEARSWSETERSARREVPLTNNGCETVPFEPTVDVTPRDSSPGSSDRQTVSIDYPPYAAADIWQAALRDADVTLPEGMGLAPGGGVGLEACSFAEFGVASTDSNAQDGDPAKCPEASHIGDISVVSPVLPTPIEGKAFFGPTDEPGEPPTPGRPTVENPWKLFLLLEGHGLRIKLVGNVSVSESGQIRTVFTRQPEVPFEKFELKMGDEQQPAGTPGARNRGVLMTPLTCSEAKGRAELTGWNLEGNPQPETAKRVSEPSVTPTCGEGGLPFQLNVDEASAVPEQAGAHSTSKIVISRPDGNQMLKNLKLSLPAGAVGSLAAIPQCPLATARAGDCSNDSKIGNVKTTVGSNDSLLTVSGSLYLAEPVAPGDPASIVLAVPAKVGPIDLGEVIVVNRLRLREADSGVDVFSEDIPAIFEGTPLPLRRIEISVDRPGFFLNPTGCDTRTLVATFTSYENAQSSSSYNLNAKGCDAVPFGPRLRLIAGAPGQTDQFDHPPFKAIVTQNAGEGAIAKARVVLPLILRPNVPFFNEPGALCTDAQAQARACPPKSLAGTARVVTPVLPYQLTGPVHIVQEIGSVLPKLYIYLRGPTGLEVLLRARNSFLQGRRIINTFDFVPDVPQSYFELSLNGGSNGILNNFEDLCEATNSDRYFDANFDGHNGKTRTSRPRLEIQGCEESDLRAASLSGRMLKVSRTGVTKMKVSCRRTKQCKGRLTIKGRGATAAKNFSIGGRKAKRVKLKFSRSEVRKIRKARRVSARATLKIGDAQAGRSSVRLVFRRR